MFFISVTHLYFINETLYVCEFKTVILAEEQISNLEATTHS